MKTKINCDSQVFVKWVEKVEKILNNIPIVSNNGHMPLEYDDEEFQRGMKDLQQCAMRFDDIPIYPINEAIARRLIEDQLQGANDRPDC
jgi:exonuclease VII small subunit